MVIDAPTAPLMHRDAQETRGDGVGRMQRKLERYRGLLRQGYSSETIRAILRLMEYLLRLPPDLVAPTYAAMQHIEMEEIGMTLVTSFEEIGLARGLTQGHADGQRELVERQLTRKLGALPADITAQLAQLDAATVVALADALLDFATVTDLITWLAQQPDGAAA